MIGEGSLFDVPPAAIGRFRVLHQVGAGTCGPVFRGVDPDADEPVAIKLFTIALPPETASSVAEALTELAATTPSLAAAVRPVAAGLHGSTPYLATSFAAGASLDVALKQFGPAALADLLPRLGALAATLDEGAVHGRLHGALHPRDVIVSEVETNLTGLGVWPILARFGQRLPMRRPYRAPELGDSTPTAVADQFALAAMAYEWMTGRRAPSAFVAADMAAVSGADTEALGLVFAKALHPDPGVRYASCAAYVDAVAEVAIPEAHAAPAQRRSRRPRERDLAPLPLDLFPPEAPAVRAETPAPAANPVSLGSTAEPARRPTPQPDEVTPPGREVTPPGRSARRSRTPPPVDGPRFGGVPHLEPEPVRGAFPVHSRPDTPLGSPRGGFGLLALFFAGVLGLAAGIGAGYTAWGRDAAPPPESGFPPTAGADTTPLDAPSSAPRSAPGPAATPPPAATSAPAAAPVTPASPPAPPTSTAASAPAPVGSLLIRSTPSGATVFVDGERRGVTPLTVRPIELGTRRVRVQRDGFAIEERQVALTQGRPSRSLDVRLSRQAPPASAAGAPAAPASAAPATAKTGTLLVESRPSGASVLLNGRPAGTTPVTIEDLAPGSYTVELQRSGYRPIRTTVRVAAGERARAAASLTVGQER